LVRDGSGVPNLHQLQGEVLWRSEWGNKTVRKGTKELQVLRVKQPDTVSTETVGGRNGGVLKGYI